jgi:acetylornithine deacetylase/succinyl-diaminopimelate desuccinylase-like protein
MKAFIAMAVAHAPQFLASDAPFAVHFAFSYDEEVGCFGVRELIADMRDAGIRPLACIVGEPTSMVPAIAHKGVYRYKCCVRGKEAHSSLTPQSVNAIEMAARLVGKVRDMAEGFERMSRATKALTCRSAPPAWASSTAALPTTWCRATPSSAMNSATCPPPTRRPCRPRCWPTRGRWSRP